MQQSEGMGSLLFHGFFALFLLLLSVCSAAAAGGDILWQAGDPLPGKQEGRATVIDSQGNTVIAGFQNISGDANDDYWAVKFKTDGSGVLWRAGYDRVGGSDQAVAVAVDANNDVIVTGTVWNGLDKDIHTIKYSGQTGSVLWSATFAGAANGNDLAKTVTVDLLNNVYVGGATQGSGGDDDGLLIKYAADDGHLLWQQTYTGAANGSDQLVSLAAGGTQLVASGQSWNGTGYDMVTLLYDLSGQTVWSSRYTPPAGGAASAGGTAVKLDSGGNVVVSGYSDNATNRDIHVVKYSAAAGAVLWDKLYNGTADDDANALWVAADGDVYVSGTTWTLTGNNDFYTVKYQGTTGDILWSNIFDSGSGNTDVAIQNGLAVDEQGELFVSGYTVAGGNYDFQTVKYKKDNGTQIWQRSFNGAGLLNDRPVGIWLSPDGGLLVAGWSETAANNLDSYLLKYDAGALNPPTGLAATTLSTAAIGLSWTDNDGAEEGFKIERKLGEFGSYQQIAAVAANVTTYSDSGLGAGNFYYYRVRAYNAANGDSHYSNEAHALTVFAPVLAPAWTYSYNSPDNLDDFTAAVAVGHDNNPVVTGSSLRTVGGFDYYTLKFNRADAGILWSDLYDDPDSELDKAVCVAVDSANDVVVSGFASLFSGAADKNINSIYTVKYPAVGPPQSWGTQYNGPGAIDDRATAIATATDATNSSYVLGYGKNAANNEDIYLVKYDANGTKLWAATPFDGGGTDIPAAVAVAADGSIYVTGFSESAPASGVKMFFTARYNGASGALVWSDRYAVIAGAESLGKGIAVAADGSVYVTGAAVTAGGSADIYTIKYQGGAAAPLRLWERSFDGAAHGDDAAVAVQVDPIDGAIVIGGTVLSSSANHDSVIIRYTAAGDTVWERVHQRPANDDFITAMSADSSGYCYLAGSTSNGATMDMLALVYDFEGNLLGVTTYNGSANGNEEASGVAVNYIGEAFISGYSENANGDADYLLVKQVNAYLLAPAPFAALGAADATRIDLSWQDSAPGAQYHLERTLGPVTAGSVWVEIASLPAASTAYQDSGLNPGSHYCYRIEAHNGALTSRKTVACATTTLLPPVVAPVTVVSATALDLSWQNVTANSGYRIERMPAGGAWAQIGTNLPADTVIYHDTGLTAGTVYSYRLVTLSSAGSSLPSRVEIAPVLNPLTGISAGTINLSWPTIAGAESYLIERSSDGLNWTQIAAPSGGATSYSDTTVAAGEGYYYRLKVVTGGIPSGASLLRNATALLQTPAFTSATAASTTAINLLWNDPNNNESGYQLQYGACSASYDNPDSCNSYVTNDSYWTAWTPLALGADTVSTTVSGLTSGRTYRFRVTATKTGANSNPSTLLTATPNLTGPTNLAAAAATESSVSLTWANILGETSYRIEQNGVLLAPVLNRNSVAYTVTGLTTNTEYCFRVQANNATSSAFSNQACVTIYGAPTLGAVTVNSQNQVTLAWADVTGEIGYEVWQSAATYQYNQPANPATGSWNAYTNLTTTPLAANTVSYIKAGLSAGYAYKYKIRYKLADGSFSAYSNELMAVTVPNTPTLSATPLSPSQIRLSWGDVYGESNYNVQQKIREAATCSAEDWSAITATVFPANTTVPTIASLVEGTIYCFRVCALNVSGTSPWGSAATAQTLLSAPVLNALSGVTQSKIDLSWNNITGNNGYRIERSLNGSAWAQIAFPAVDVAAWSDTTVAANQIYYYRVSVRNSLGNYSLVSNVRNATTPPVTPPVLAPLSGITTTQITVNWGAVAENNGYKVERSLNSTAWTEVATAAVGAVSYTDSGLSAGTLYYYRVATINAAGSYSLPSNVLGTTTTPAAPVLSLNISSEARIDLSWPVVKGATNYQVLRAIGGSGPPWTEIANHPAAYTTLYCGIYTLPSIGCPTLVPVTTTLADEGLSRDTTYCYQINAWNATGGYSASSSTVCAKTPAVNGPDLLAVTPLTAMKISLEWSYAPQACTPEPCLDADGFEIWRQLVSGTWARIATTANVTSYVDSVALEPLKTYHYRLRAYKGADVSIFSTVKDTTTPAFASEANTCP